jgi:hypothetical protein
MFQKKFVEQIKTHILCSIIFFLKNHAVCEKNVEKYCEAGHATDENLWRAISVPDS